MRCTTQYQVTDGVRRELHEVNIFAIVNKDYNTSIHILRTGR